MKMFKKKRNLKEEQFVERASILRILVSFFLFLFSFSVYSYSSFYFTSKIELAQQKSIELQIDSARLILNEEKRRDLDNYSVDYVLHLNYFLEAFITEDKEVYKQYESIKENCLKNYSNLSDSLPFKKFAQSEVYFYSAALKAKQNELYSAAKDVNKAHSLIEENHTLFPNFILNNKARGLMKVYLSTVPDNYKWVIKLLGAKGDMNEGLRLLNQLATSQDTTPGFKWIQKETQYLYCFSLFTVAKQKAKAWAEMLKYTSDYKSNGLSTFFRSNIALKMNRNETAIKVLENRPSSKDYLHFYFLDYQLGLALLHKQDVRSIEYLKIFYNNHKGENYKKSCLQKMSWYYLLAADFEKYLNYKKAILTKGYTQIEEDKQAERYAEKKQPNRILLKARLLYDGGYYTNALKVIDKLVVKELSSNDEKAEYCYRKGRIYQQLGQLDKSLKYYEACTLFGLNSSEYYASYACLFLGDYYLKKGENNRAKEFYKRALNNKKNQEYRESIEHRAKVGLKKV